MAPPCRVPPKDLYADARGWRLPGEVDVEKALLAAPRDERQRLSVLENFRPQDCGSCQTE